MQYEGVIPEHRAVRERRRRVRRLAHGRARRRGPAARASSCSRCSRTTSSGSSPGQAQYTLLTNEQRRDRRRPDRLRARARAVPADRERVEPRGRLRLAEGARAARRRRARRLRRVRADRRAGAARARAARAAPTRRAFTFAEGEIDGVACMVNRTGYTGEEGVELLVAGRRGRRALGRASLERGVVPCGLGARDTLRLEVCYPLHGNDIAPGDRRDLGRARLGLRARHGLHRRRGAAPDQGGRPRAEARRVRDGGARRSRGRGCRSSRAARSRPGSHSPMLDRGIGHGLRAGRAGAARARS